jgi:hypothetical protein
MRKFILIAAIFLVGVAGFSGCGSVQKARIYPAGDFRDNGNGTVTDNVTGLMWQQEDNYTRDTWEEALKG